MIKHVLVAAAVTLPAVGARAADLPLARKAPAMSSSLFTWTGFYGGINAGFKFSGDDDVHTEGQAAPNIANIAGGARPGFVPLNRNGVIGGGQIGLNYQIGQFVAGIETDFDYTDFRDNRSVTTAQLVTGLPLNNNFSSRLDFLGTVRGRLGFAYDHSRFYATGVCDSCGCDCAKRGRILGETDGGWEEHRFSQSVFVLRLFAAALSAWSRIP